MRGMIVKEQSAMVGKRCRHCPRPVRAGQSVLVAELPTTGYRDPQFIVHTECMAAAVEAAPKGIPVTSKRAARGRFAQLAAHVEAGGSPFDIAV